MLPVVEAFTPVAVFHTLQVEARSALTLDPAHPVVKFELLFFYISQPDSIQVDALVYLPYIEFVRYATAPHSIFFII